MFNNMNNIFNIANIESDYKRHTDRHNEVEISPHRWGKRVIIVACIIVAALLLAVFLSPEKKQNRF